jgi:hypothetical protein
VVVAAVMVGMAGRAAANPQPPVDWSWYVDTTSTSHIQQLGCNQANYDRSVGHNSEVVLDFGAYNSDGSSQILFNNTWQSEGTVTYLAEWFVYGYIICNPGNQYLTVAVGGSNYNTMSYNAGVNSAYAARNVGSYATNNSSHVFVRGSEDIETWSGRAASSQMYNWYNGWHAASGPGYVNFGSADGCPTAGTGWWCSYGWNAGDYYNFSWGFGEAYFTPETYYNVNAAQWNWIAYRTHPMYPDGPMNQPNGAGNNPGQAWAALNQYFPYMSYSLEIHWM